MNEEKLVKELNGQQQHLLGLLMNLHSNNKTILQIQSHNKEITEKIETANGIIETLTFIIKTKGGTIEEQEEITGELLKKGNN